MKISDSRRNSRKRVYVDWTYCERGSDFGSISAFSTKDDCDYISYVREQDVKKEIAAWRLAAETWKKAHDDLSRSVFAPKRRCLKKKRGVK